MNPEKLTKLLRDKQRRYRERKKAEKEEKEARKITEEMQKGNLNYGMKPDPSFEDYETYHQENPESRKADYIKAKFVHDRNKIRKHSEFDQSLSLIHI